MDPNALLKELPIIYLFLISASAIVCPDNLPLDVQFVLPSTGSCYFFSNTKTTFGDTKNVCEGESGGHVVFLESYAEQIELQTELTTKWSFTGRSYWLGLERIDTGWYWTIFKNSGRILTTFKKFGTAPPTSSSPVKLHLGLDWVVASTEDYNYPVCEIDLASPLTFDISPVVSETTATQPLDDTTVSPSSLNLVRAVDTMESDPVANYLWQDKGIFEYTVMGLYATQRFSPEQSFIECAALCLNSEGCKGISCDVKTNLDCFLLHNTWNPQTTYIDCTEERCFIKV